jgi:hypothetical protein
MFRALALSLVVVSLGSIGCQRNKLPLPAAAVPSSSTTVAWQAPRIATPDADRRANAAQTAVEKPSPCHLKQKTAKDRRRTKDLG